MSDLDRDCEIDGVGQRWSSLAVASAPSEDIVRQVMNLHDVFLNASMLRKRMQDSPLKLPPRDGTAERDGERAFLFSTSDRGRFERMWLTFLFVLIEAWLAKNSQATRSYIQQVENSGPLDELLDRARTSGHLKKLAAVRHYMCHRDKRAYWDDGRIAQAYGSKLNAQIQVAFSKLFLAVFAEFRKHRVQR